MFKKALILSFGLFILSFACKKDEVCTVTYEVNSFSLNINSENIGLYKEEGRNTETKIRSIRNQFMFKPDKNYKTSIKHIQKGWDFIPAAYAARCVDVEVSETSFDPVKTFLSIDKDLNLALYGYNGIIPKGDNLLANEQVRGNLLKELVSNDFMHSGMEIPITLSKEFLKPLNGNTLKFTLKLYTAIGIAMSDSVTASIDIIP